MNAPLPSNIPPSISQFEHDHFTLAQTIDNVGIGQALHNLSDFGWKIVNYNHPTPVSSSSQLELGGVHVLCDYSS